MGADNEPLSSEQILAVLRDVEDPEAPVSIVDLGLVANCGTAADGVIEVELIPTRAGCPARELIRLLVEKRLKVAFGDRDIRCRWLDAATWSTGLISPEGRRRLREYGIAIPELDSEGRRWLRCPYCDSVNVRQESPFGASVCRAIWYCNSCHNPFEEMRWLEEGTERHSLQKEVRIWTNL